MSTEKSADVITTCIHIVVDDKHQIQSNESLKPNWSKFGEFVDIHKKMETEIDNGLKAFWKCYHYHYCYHFVNDLQNTVKHVCSNCAEIYHTLKRKCSNCGSVVLKYERLKSVSRDEGISKRLNVLDIGRNKAVERNFYGWINLLIPKLEEIMKEAKKQAIDDDRDVGFFLGAMDLCMSWQKESSKIIRKNSIMLQWYLVWDTCI